MGFDSMAKANDLPATSLAEMSVGEARAMLKDHVLWTSWRRRNDDLLISFTSSFLFALQHAIRKSNGCYKSKCANCFIAMIDTTKFSYGTFTWTPTLLRTYGLDENTDLNLRYSSHEAEYLAQYDLLLLESGASTVTSLAELANKGELFRALPGLAKDSKELVRALQDARRDWYHETRAISKSEIQQARKLALCFGGEWFCPIVIWVLAMKARPSDNTLLREEFGDKWHGVYSKASTASTDKL